MCSGAQRSRRAALIAQQDAPISLSSLTCREARHRTPPHGVLGRHQEIPVEANWKWIRDCALRSFHVVFAGTRPPRGLRCVRGFLTARRSRIKQHLRAEMEMSIRHRARVSPDCLGNSAEALKKTKTNKYFIILKKQNKHLNKKTYSYN